MANRWTQKEEAWLLLEWGMKRLRVLAGRLGRSETAVSIKAKKLGLVSPCGWDNFLTACDLAVALGVDDKTAARLMCGPLKGLRVKMYRRNSPIRLVPLVSLVEWIGRPENWYCLDVDKVADARLVAEVRRVRSWWRDEWWGVGRAATELNVCDTWVSDRIRSGQIAGRKHGNNWQVFRSTILGIKAEMGDGSYWLVTAVDDFNQELFLKA
jgi:hypothetical protein